MEKFNVRKLLFIICCVIVVGIVACSCAYGLMNIHDKTCVIEQEPVVEIVTPTPEPSSEPEPIVEEETCEIIYDDVYYEPVYYEYIDLASYDYPDGDGVLTRSGGVNYYGGNRETWYSSNSLYHYRTSEWSCGDDGVYRNDDGYVIVASSDLEQGSIVETSLGTGIVEDSGCASGTVDIYTAW